MKAVESKRTCEIIEGTVEEKADLLLDKLISAGVL
jgi:hypothetical protein